MPIIKIIHIFANVLLIKTIDVKYKLIKMEIPERKKKI
jgi:hypothetical protein